MERKSNYFNKGKFMVKESTRTRKQLKKKKKNLRLFSLLIFSTKS